MNQELRATIVSHTASLNGREIELILVPDDVSESNADSYLQFLRAYKRVPMILVLPSDEGGCRSIYSDLSPEETEAIFSLSPQSLVFGRERYFHTTSDADEMPTWPPARK